MRVWILLLVFTLVLSDTPGSVIYANPAFANIEPLVRYEVSINLTTSDGVAVDAHDVHVNVDQIDKLVDEFETCYGQPVIRYGFQIKVMKPDLMYPQEAFWCMIGETGFCHGLVQYPATLVVTPNMNALKHEMVHAIGYRLHGDELFRCE